jgi:hypothetical protein
MDAQALPGTIVAKIKRVPKAAWLIVGLVVLLVLWVMTKGKGGTEVVAGQGISGTSGGGGGGGVVSSGEVVPIAEATAPNPLTGLLEEQQTAQQSFLNQLLATLQTGTMLPVSTTDSTPGGGTPPGTGAGTLPGAYVLGEYTYEGMIAAAKASGGTTAQQGSVFDQLVQGNANRLWNAMADALRGGETPASAYKRLTGEAPGAAELNLTSQQYLNQKLGQYPGSPSLGKIDVAVSWDPVSYLAWLKKVGPTGYVSVNSGRPDPGEWQRAVDAATIIAGGGTYTGISPAPSGQGGSPTISDGATTANANAARIAFLQKAISTPSAFPSMSAATLAKYKTELAGLK